MRSALKMYAYKHEYQICSTGSVRFLLRNDENRSKSPRDSKLTQAIDRDGPSCIVHCVENEIKLIDLSFCFWYCIHLQSKYKINRFQLEHILLMMSAKSAASLTVFTKFDEGSKYIQRSLEMTFLFDSISMTQSARTTNQIEHMELAQHLIISTTTNYFNVLIFIKLK